MKMRVRAAGAWPVKEGGLTLVELLVAIAITAVLLILLMTGTRSMVNASRSAACLTNLKQLGAYVTQYAVEHRGRLLPTLDRNTSDDGKSGKTWFQLLDQEKILPFSQWHQLPKSAMCCPARNSPNPRPQYGNRFPSKDYNGSHYGMLSQFGFGNLIEKGKPPNKLTQIQNPSQTILIAEADYWYYITPKSTSYRSYPHNGGSNLLYADGHGVFHAGELPIYSDAELNKPTAPPFF